MYHLLIKKSVEEELNNNLLDSYEHVREADIPMDANIVDYHLFYKIKVDESEKKILKAISCRHGNMDRMTGSIRTD